MEEKKAAEEEPASAGPDDGAQAPRPSRAEPPRTRSPNYRIAIAALWIAGQITLILTADRRPDGAFGFRMFSESSTMRLALYREVDGPDGRPVRVHVERGGWQARGDGGVMHRLSWYDRVPSPFWAFDEERHASYGARAQLARLGAALDDVAANLPASEDGETRRLVLDVTIRRNGREPVVHELVSRERALPGGR